MKKIPQFIKIKDYISHALINLLSDLPKHNDIPELEFKQALLDMVNYATDFNNDKEYSIQTLLYRGFSELYRKREHPKRVDIDYVSYEVSKVLSTEVKCNACLNLVIGNILKKKFKIKKVSLEFIDNIKKGLVTQEMSYDDKYNISVEKIMLYIGTELNRLENEKYLPRTLKSLLKEIFKDHKRAVIHKISKLSKEEKIEVLKSAEINIADIEPKDKSKIILNMFKDKRYPKSINLSELDFSNYEIDVDVSHMSVNGNLYQGCQVVTKNIYQAFQEFGKYLYNNDTPEIKEEEKE